MFSSLVAEGIVLSPPELRKSKTGLEYLRCVLGLVNGKSVKGARYTFLECTIWNNVNLTDIVKGYNLQRGDKVLVEGQFQLDYVRSKIIARLYLHNMIVLNYISKRFEENEYDEEEPPFYNSSFIDGDMEEGIEEI